MDIAQLRYPVAYWDGTPPIHHITCIAVTPQVPQTQRIVQSINQTNNVTITATTTTETEEIHRRKAEIKHYAITGSTTGELVHWEIHQLNQQQQQQQQQQEEQQQEEEIKESLSSSSSFSSPPFSSTVRVYYPRALLLRQGSARVSCCVSCCLSEIAVFLIGTVEGFLSLWTVTGGRCIKSALVVPFAPSTLITYQRDVRVRIGKISGNSEHTGRKKLISKTYVIVSSAQSPFVYIISLPHLKTIKILKHDYEVANSNIANITVKKTTVITNTNTAKPATTTGITTTTTTTTNHKQTTTATTTTQTSTAAITTIRPVLHCLTIGGTFHRWDLLDLTSRDSLAPTLTNSTAALVSTTPSSSASSIVSSDDQSNLQLLVNKSRTPIIKLPFPSLANHFNAAPNLPSAGQSTLIETFFPVSSCLSGSGNLLLIALQSHFCIFSIPSKQLETPLIPLKFIFPSASQENSLFAGSLFLPSFQLQGILMLKMLLWSTDGHIALVSIISNSPTLAASASSANNPNANSASPADDNRKKLIIKVLARFLLETPVTTKPEHQNNHVNHLPHRFDNGIEDVDLQKRRSHSHLTIQINMEPSSPSKIQKHQPLQLQQISSGPPSVDSNMVPNSVILDGNRVVSGNNNGEMIEWIIPSEWMISPPITSELNPFQKMQSFTSTAAFTSSSSIFYVHVVSDFPVIILPSCVSSVASAFGNEAVQSHPILTAVGEEYGDALVCTSSVLLTEGSGKTVLLARGFQTGLIRIFGPASRSPSSPTGAGTTFARSSSFSLSPPASPHSPRQRSASISMDTVVIDLTAHSRSITCLLSIGGREFSCHHALMASGSEDMSVCVWDVSNATLLKRIRLSSAVSSLHRPALTEDDYQYHSQRLQNDAALQETKIKEEYQQTMENKPFISNDVIFRPEDGGENGPIERYASPDSPNTRSLSISIGDEDGAGASSAGLGVIFISCIDFSVRVYSLHDYQLLQTFRGHDDSVLTIYRDICCIKEEQIIVLTDRHSIYVWSMVDGSLSSYLTGDAGALRFLQLRGLIAPGSQLSILAHHIRQRAKRMLQGDDSKKELRDEAAAFGTETDDKEKENGLLERSAALRDRFHIRTKSSSNIHPSASASALSSIPTSPRGSSSSSSNSSAFSLSSSSTNAASIPNAVYSPHNPSSEALQHPASSFLQSHRPIDRATQHLILSTMMNPENTHQEHSSNSNNSGTGDIDSAPPAALTREGSFSTPKTTSIVKPTLLKRASNIISDRDKDKDSEASNENGANRDNNLNNPSVVPVDPGAHEFQMPVMDPVLGTKKLKHTIDAIRVDGKAHLHLSMFVINLNRFIRDLEKRYIYVRSSATPSGSSSPRSTNSQSYVEHHPSDHHLAVEPLDPTPQEELNYLLSTLFDWDDTSATTQMLRDHFHVHSPFPIPAYAAITDNSQALTVLFPAYCQGFRRWQLDSDMTARQALAIAAVCTPLLASVDVTSQTYFSKIVAHYNSLLPIRLSGYVEPDITILALFSVNSNEHVHSSAGLLLRGVIERGTAAKRREWMDSWSLYYTYSLPAATSTTTEKEPSLAATLLSPKKRDTSPTRSSSSYSSSSSSCLSSAGVGYVSDQEMMTALVLTLIGLTEISNHKYSKHEHPDNDSSNITNIIDDSDETLSMFDDLSAHIANTFYRVLSWTSNNHANDIVKCTMAVDLLSRSLPLFIHHFPRPESVIHRLYLLSMSKHPSLATAANRCLLEFGKIDPQAFVSCMGKEALSSRNSTHVRQSAFLGISNLVKRHSLSLAKSLPSAVNICVKCLDPEEPAVRKTLMNFSLAALSALVQQYPTVALHQGTQRFAVATSLPKPAILIYDLKAAQKIRTIDSPKGSEIAAVAFSAHGTYLSAYFAVEQPAAMRAWSLIETNSGGFLGLGRLMQSSSTVDKTLVKTWTLSTVKLPSAANGYYQDAHSTMLKWAEEEDRGFHQLKRIKSKTKTNSKDYGGTPTTTATTTATPIPIATSSNTTTAFTITTPSSPTTKSLTVRIASDNSTSDSAPSSPIPSSIRSSTFSPPPSPQKLKRSESDSSQIDASSDIDHEEEIGELNTTIVAEHTNSTSADVSSTAHTATTNTPASATSSSTNATSPDTATAATAAAAANTATPANTATTGTSAGLARPTSSPKSPADDDDPELVAQLILKCMLYIKLEWKDDNEMTLTRENGAKKNYFLAK